MKHTPEGYTRDRSEAYLASDIGKNAPYALVVAAICRSIYMRFGADRNAFGKCRGMDKRTPAFEPGPSGAVRARPERILSCAQEMIISIPHYVTLLNFVWVVVYCVGLPKSSDPPLHDGPEDQPTVRTELGDSQ